MTTEPLRSAAQNAESRQLPAEGPRASRGQGAPRWALSYALGDDATALGDDATQRGTHSANTDPSLGVRHGDRSVEQLGPSPQSAAPHFKTRPSRSGPYVAPPPTSPRPHATHPTPPPTPAPPAAPTRQGGVSRWAKHQTRRMWRGPVSQRALLPGPASPENLGVRTEDGLSPRFSGLRWPPRSHWNVLC